MITITTSSINGRSDWYHAQATVHGRIYDSFMSTRLGAFMEVARQLAVKGILKW